MKKKSIVLLLFTFLLGFASAQNPNKEKKLSDEKRLEWWHNAKFGMFIHWGVYALYGGNYNGHEQTTGGAEWIMNRCKIPVSEYQEKAKEFNPVNYNAEAWVKMAKDAGMKYIVITAKHHDGFALFETKASKWNVVEATPYGKDLLKPLAAACKKYGMKLGFYYSQSQDWNNPGGIVSRRLMKNGYPNPDSAAIDKYTEEHQGHWDPVQETKSFDDYINNVAVPQVKEILSNYGEISVLWWDTPTYMTNDAALKLQEQLKLQPNIITNDRLKHPNFLGDTKTPEQKIPNQKDLEGQNWETCMTMNGTWGYRKSDNNWKSTETLIRNLVDITSKGGNYLLNVGPKPDGSFPEESIERLAQMGKWMKTNSEAVYETKASPLGLFEWGRCTKKIENGNTTLYFAVFNWPADGKLLIPGLKNKVFASSLLADGKILNSKLVAQGLMIDLPLQAPDAITSVIKIKVKGLVNQDKKLVANLPPAKKKINVLIVDGFSNHDWKQTTKVTKYILEESGLFNISVSTVPPNKSVPLWHSWNPEFHKYDVVIQNCNNLNMKDADWPQAVKLQLEDYVSKGGALYILHSANNSFVDWPAYNDMIGLGWRNADAGDAIEIAADKSIITIPSGQGEKTNHGAKFNALVQQLNHHPINKDFPEKWLSARTELYRFARGSAKNITILSFAQDSITKRNWPMDWLVKYGKGNVYNSSMGHLWKGEIYPPGFRCIGFQTTLIRATEWLATGKVTYKLPETFPTQRTISMMPETTIE